MQKLIPEVRRCKFSDKPLYVWVLNYSSGTYASHPFSSPSEAIEDLEKYANQTGLSFPIIKVG